MLGFTIEEHVVECDVHGVIRQRCFIFVGIAFVDDHGELKPKRLMSQEYVANSRSMKEFN